MAHDAEEELRCLDRGRGGCTGQVEYRTPLTASGKSFPRCDKHWGDRLDFQAETNRKYGGAVALRGFDPMAAGERWDEEDPWP